MPRLIAFNKPFGVVTQFSPHAGRTTLADFIAEKDVYPAGRLDHDSEGLLLLTSDGALQHRIAHPASKLVKSYWAQVEGVAHQAGIDLIRGGLDLGDFVSHPCEARLIAEPPDLWPRQPPIRERKAIPTSWIEVSIAEGKNRQVRRMTAKAGLPTLRLIRHRIGPYLLGDLLPGTWREIDSSLIMDPVIGRRRAGGSRSR
jgi:23S rRNA pseudouridine2457 synthase